MGAETYIEYRVANAPDGSAIRWLEKRAIGGSTPAQAAERVTMLPLAQHSFREWLHFADEEIETAGRLSFWPGNYRERFRFNWWGRCR